MGCHAPQFKRIQEPAFMRKRTKRRNKIDKQTQREMTDDRDEQTKSTLKYETRHRKRDT